MFALELKTFVLRVVISSIKVVASYLLRELERNVKRHANPILAIGGASMAGNDSFKSFSRHCQLLKIDQISIFDARVDFYQ